MKLETMGQSDPQEGTFELGRYVSMLFRQNRWYMDQRMSAFGLGSGQYMFLFFLYNHNGANQDEISKALELDKATTARAIQKLEERGFVTRSTSEKDKRVNQVFLTQEAYDIQRELKSISSEWKAILVEGMDLEELDMLETLFGKLLENAKTYRGIHCKKGGQHDK